jgi:DNA processing protein
MQINDTNVSGFKFLKPYKSLKYFGNLDLLDQIGVTIVGSRKITSYGKQIVSDLCAHLSSYSLVTVSGYVDGVDFEVFKNSLQNALPTILCLGYGFNYFSSEKFNQFYKRYSTKKDYKDVLVVSQFDDAQNAARWTFPRRDDLLASIGTVMVVIEAAKKSGTFYTVKRAIKEKKQVFAVPGNIYSVQSIGTNNLIKTGFNKTCAQIYLEPNDITKHLKLDIVEAKSSSDTTKLSNDEKIVLKAISGDSQHFDDIQKQTKLPPEKLNVVLVKLELRGFIKTAGSSQFFRIK